MCKELRDLHRTLTRGLTALHRSEEMQLRKLSELGHFLKGSSSTLGLIKLQKTCEKIQNYGKGLDATGTTPFPDPPDNRKSAEHIQSCITDAKSEFVEAKDILKRFFEIADDEL